MCVTPEYWVISLQLALMPRKSLPADFSEAVVNSMCLVFGNSSLRSCGLAHGNVDSTHLLVRSIRINNVRKIIQEACWKGQAKEDKLPC